MRLNELIPDIGRSVAYYPSLVPLVGGIKPALLLCQLIYWSDKGKAKDGWIYRSAAELQLETGLSPKEQMSARKHLRSCYVLREHYARLEHKMYFRVDFDEFRGIISEASQRPDDESPEYQAASDQDEQPRSDERANRSIQEKTTKSRPDARASSHQKKKCESLARKTKALDLLKELDILSGSPLFEKLEEVCRMQVDFVSGQKQAEFINTLRLLDNSKITPERLHDFLVKWSFYWRCVNNRGRAPQPREVIECWDEVMNLISPQFE